MCSMLPAMAKDLVLLYTQLVEKGEMVERKRHDRMRDRGPRPTFFLRMEGLRRKPQKALTRFVVVLVQLEVSFWKQMVSWMMVDVRAQGMG